MVECEITFPHPLNFVPYVFRFHKDAAHRWVLINTLIFGIGLKFPLFVCTVF
jgi:hypothetical protein